MSRTRTSLLGLYGCSTLALALACGGGGSGSLPAPAPTSGTVGFLATDATSETWSEVGVIIRKASLVLASDTAAASPVTIYSAPADTTPINLIQADQVDDLLAQVSGVPPGTYDRIILEVDGSPANLTLVPAPTVAGTASAAIDPSLITVKGTSDSANPTWKILPTITLTTPLTVAAGQTSAVRVDFDLAHPAFIVEHDTTAQTLYVVNFGTKGIFKQKPAASLDQYYLRRHLGTVASVAADGTSFNLTTEHGQTLAIKAEAGSSPTLFYDLNGTPPVNGVASGILPATLAAGLDVAATARYQADGSLTAVRVWYATTAADLPSWTPEGHIYKIDRAKNILYVLNSKGTPNPYTVDASTKFYFKGDVTTDLAGGKGAAFLAQMERYFKVHLTVVDPTATPVVAATVDIQRAEFEGNITQSPAATTSGFTYYKVFADGSTSTHTLSFDPTFSFWNFTFPATASTSLAGFLSEADSSIVLNVNAAQFMPYGSSSMNWSTATSGWEAINTIFMPIQISTAAQTITTAFAGTSLTVTPKDAGALPVTVDLDPAAQQQPLVTEYTKSGATVTVTTLTTAQWAGALTAGTKVRVYGVPDGNGNLKAYYVNIYN